MTLTNGVRIEGSFGGNWLKRIEISKAVLEDPVVEENTELRNSMKELQ